MATVIIQIDLKEDEQFLISNKDAKALIDIIGSLEDLENRKINEVD